MIKLCTYIPLIPKGAPHALLLLVVILVISPVRVNAQYYSSGEDPASVRWYQINTTNFRIVYPQELEKDAQRMAAILDEAYSYVSHSLDHQPRKISVLIHSRTAYANGFVSWAPKRIELYPTASQSIYPHDWLEQLGLHEFRHVVQIDRLNRGFTRLLYYILGEQAIGTILGINFPLWFLEGDAVISETLLSESGRGRLPSFEQGLRAQLIEKKRYSYNKAYLGSYRDHVPNHYEMGYHLVAGARQQYGAKLWEKTGKNVGNYSFWPFVFNGTVKSVTGKSKVKLYQSVFDSLANQWNKQDQQLKLTPFTNIASNSNKFKNYLFPQPSEDGSVIAEIKGPGERQRFVSISGTGKEKTIYRTGLRNDEPFSYQNGTLIWAELDPHIRYDNVMYSVIKTADVKTGRTQKLTSRSHYFSPALSVDGSKIAAINVSHGNRFFLDILDATTGKRIKTFSYPDYPILTPSWNATGESVVAVVLTPTGKKLVELDIEKGKWTSLTAPMRHDISLPRYHADKIVFNASFSGIDNIYALNLSDTTIYQLTSDRFGATSPTLNGNKLYYSRYTSNGYKPVVANMDQLMNQSIHKVENTSIKLYKGLEKEEKGVPQLTSNNASTYPSYRYSKWNLFRFHSWAPLFLNLKDTEVHPGISLMSQNLLSTMVIEAGYNADKNYSIEKYYLNLSYKGWFPVFDLNVKAGDRSIKIDDFFHDKTDTFKLYANTKQYVYQIKPGIRFPLNLSSGNSFRRIEPSINYSWYFTSGYEYQRTNGTFINKIFQPGETSVITIDDYNYQGLEYDLYMFNLKRTTQRDLTPRWGQLVELNYRHNPAGDLDRGYTAAVLTRIYLPGFFKHHSFKFDNNYQIKMHGEKSGFNDTYQLYYRFSDIITFPRGIEPSYNDRLYSFKGEYIFPLANPDLSASGIFYLKRLKTKLFYDYSRADYSLERLDNQLHDKFHREYKSMGAELMAETHVARFFYPIEVGCRYIYLPDEKKHVLGFLFAINLSGFAVNQTTPANKLSEYR